MALAVPVAVRFLQQGNQELSRNMSSYLSLAAIAKAELLAQHTEAITCSVLGGRGATWGPGGGRGHGRSLTCHRHTQNLLGYGDFTKCLMFLDQHRDVTIRFCHGVLKWQVIKDLYLLISFFIFNLNRLSFVSHSLNCKRKEHLTIAERDA